MLIVAERDKPYIHLSETECNFEIKGHSYSVLIDEIYQKVVEWTEEKLPDIECEMIWKFQFEMISSASLKGLIKILETLDNFYNQGKKIKIKWISPADDSDIIEIGNDLSEITSIPFDFVQRY